MANPRLVLYINLDLPHFFLLYALHVLRRQIAEHVDSTGGFLSKLSLYKALALIALAQQGKQPSPKLLENCIQGR